MISVLRLILWPFSILYGFVIRIRNFMYDRGLLKSTKFSFPVIVVGNLAVGGTGKSPITEFLIRILKDRYKIATLSRGYGRKTSGFLYVNPADSAKAVGDEPLQFKSKFPDITVAVCEDRVLGVSKLKEKNQVVILDDAYQHRALVPGLSILLIEYQSLFGPKLLLPAGNFRDTFSQRKRADMVIVSKCPDQLPIHDREKLTKQLSLGASQSVFFSYLTYGEPYLAFSEKHMTSPVSATDDVLLVSGIANPKPLQNYLEPRCKSLKLLQYPDHHNFTDKDIQRFIDEYELIQSSNKYILTTEKDYQRLKGYSERLRSYTSPAIRVIPVQVSFHDQDEAKLSSIVQHYCKDKIS